MDREDWVSQEWTQQLLKDVRIEIEVIQSGFIEGEFVSDTIEATATKHIRAQTAAKTLELVIQLIKEGKQE